MPIIPWPRFQLPVIILARAAVGSEGMLPFPPPPADIEYAAAFTAIVQQHHAEDLEAPIEIVVDEIDAIVGPALGLSFEDVASIRRELTEDPFLKNIKPRYPASATRIHGYRTGLDSSERHISSAKIVGFLKK
ncbi:hypothetical protein [Mesorhizobium waimense]|uniref:hypothetical protein n=1 Tax=Mesorhizobium waimense TaxID=1300307 RepID=UPI0011C40D6C|nr:hypothetical protein [Mesorhizobium waimense]